MMHSGLLANITSLIGTTRASRLAFGLIFVLAVSLPPKWATLHFAGFGLVLIAGFARQNDWQSRAMRTYLLCTMAWLIPVLLSAGLQHALGVATAPPGSDLLVLVLRILGIGIGIIILIQRGWLSLSAAVFAIMFALSLHVGAGLIEWLADSEASLATWRQIRLDGLVGNPNPFGLFMALTLLLTTGLLRQAPHSATLWILLIATLFCLLASASRGAAMTAAVGMLVLFPPNTRKRLIVMLLYAALVALMIWQTGLQIDTLTSDEERLKALGFTLEQIRSAPWLGWGIDAYERLPGHIGPNSPHNMLLDLAVSSGLPTLAGWLLATTLLIVRLARHASPSAHLALSLLLASIVAGTLEYSLLNSTHFRGIWVLVTALACCTLVTRDAISTTRDMPNKEPA